MIKRQFYALEHASHAAEASSASSSSSSASHHSAASQSDADSGDAQSPHEVSSPVAIRQNRVKEESAEESDDDNSVKRAWEAEEDESEASLERSHEGKGSKSKLSSQWADAVTETIKERAHDFGEECVVMCKNVLKCRLCPKTLCLTAETMRAHLSSKKHARSLKHLEEGKLKLMLNSDGEEEEQGETHAERYARTVASAQEINPQSLKRKRDSGRQRQRKRAKRKAMLLTKKGGPLPSIADHGKNRNEPVLQAKKGKTKLRKLSLNSGTGKAKTKSST